MYIWIHTYIHGTHGYHLSVPLYYKHVSFSVMHPMLYPTNNCWYRLFNFGRYSSHRSYTVCSCNFGRKFYLSYNFDDISCFVEVTTPAISVTSILYIYIYIYIYICPHSGLFSDNHVYHARTYIFVKNNESSLICMFLIYYYRLGI